MEWLDQASVGFIVVFLATLFLIGELLVKTKGLFAILGLAFITLYFAHHIEGAASIWILALYAGGLMLIIFDGKVTGDGTFGVIGIILMSLSVAVPTPGILYGVLAVFGFLLGIVGALVFLKVFPRRGLWDKITLKDKLSSDSGYNSMNESYKGLIGKKGKALTDFRPSGTIEVEGERYSATSGGQWIKNGVEIEVVSADGTRILVRKTEEASQTSS